MGHVLKNVTEVNEGKNRKSQQETQKWKSTAIDNLQSAKCTEHLSLALLVRWKWFILSRRTEDE